jgi:hypothetical protein
MSSKTEIFMVLQIVSKGKNQMSISDWAGRGYAGRGEEETWGVAEAWAGAVCQARKRGQSPLRIPQAGESP